MSVQNVTTYTVVVSFTNPDGPQPLPGMTANVRIVTDARENVLRLPNAALRVRLAGVAAPADSASAARREGKALRPPGAQAGGGSGTGVQRGRIFVLASDEKGRMQTQPQAYSVRLGITDGLFTELLAPSNEASSPQEGSTVIVGVNAPTDKPGAPSGPRSPF